VRATAVLVAVACVPLAITALPLAAAAGPITETYPTIGESRKADLTIAAGVSTVLAYSADGRAVASGHEDGSIAIWQARTGEQCTGERLLTLAGHKRPVRALASKADGTLVSIAEDRTVKIWNIESGAMVRSTPLDVDPRLAVFRPGKEPMLASAEGARIRVWDYDAARVVREMEAPGDVSHLAFSPDGAFLVAATADGGLHVFEATAGKRTRSFDRVDPVRALAASASHVLVGTADGTVTAFLTSGQEPPVALAGTKSPVSAVAFSSKGDQLAAAGDDGVVRVWDTATGTLLCVQEGHEKPVAALAFNPNGQKMVSAGADGTIRYWTTPLPPIPTADLEKITAALPSKASAAPKKSRRVLVFWRADAILHKGGVPAANHAIELLGRATAAYETDFSRDYDALDPAVLSRYDAIVLNSTAHLAIPEQAKAALLEFAQGGGGVIGIHAAIDTFRQWPEGAEIVGATFGGHPWGPSGSWAVHVEEPDHPLNRAWAAKDFRIHDEVYELADPYRRGDRRVLLSLDMSDPATAGVTPLHRADRDFAVSWIKKHGRGRVFFAMFGHIGEPFQIPAVLQFYLDGIQYALGDLEVDDSPRDDDQRAKGLTQRTEP